MISEGGANFSVGQRQLLCLGARGAAPRAVLVLDEATASIDNETDAILQKAIRHTFEECTVLTIAHRLHTIMDSTHIMLFDKGALKEHAPPDTLLDDPESSLLEARRQHGERGGAPPPARRRRRGGAQVRGFSWEGKGGRGGKAAARHVN